MCSEFEHMPVFRDMLCLAVCARGSQLLVTRSLGVL